MKIDELKEKLNSRIREIDEIISTETNEWIKEYLKIEKIF
jgi:hypothetical protein